MKNFVYFIFFSALTLVSSIEICQGAQLLGLNKLELQEQYLGIASGGDGSDSYKEVTVAMAKKSIEDAADMKAAFLRVGVSGFWPNQPGQKNDLELWRRDPEAYWHVMDTMLNNLEAHKLGIVPLFVWNISQFPAIVGDRYDSFLRNPQSNSYQLLERYVREFVMRYKTHKAIVFYDLANEFNLSADLDVKARCAKEKNAPLCANPVNITSEDVVEFLKRLAALIRSIDPQRKISSGYSINRPSATHLRQNPEWMGGESSWAPDDFPQFVQNLREMNSMVDIISVHLYSSRENRRFGIQEGDESRMLDYVKRAADEIGKPLFIGEFGEYDSMRAASPGGFSDRFMRDLIRLKIPYAALWGLEFYPRKPYYEQLGRQELGSVEFGYTDYIIKRFMETAAAMGQGETTRADHDRSPPRIVLTWPLRCASINKTQLVYAMASDDSLKVDRVEFWLDQKELATVGVPPYRYMFDPRQIVPGLHAIQAKAFDAAGNASVVSRRVLINTAHDAASINCH